MFLLNDIIFFCLNFVFSFFFIHNTVTMTLCFCNTASSCSHPLCLVQVDLGVEKLVVVIVLELPLLNDGTQVWSHANETCRQTQEEQTFGSCVAETETLPSVYLCVGFQPPELR